MRPFTAGETTRKALTLQLDPNDDEAEQRIRAALERRFGREVAAALRGQLDALLPANATDEEVRQALDRLEESAAAVRDALRRNLQRSAQLGVTTAADSLAQIGVGIDWAMAHTAAAEWADRYSYELVRGITDTTRARVQTAIDEWVRNGDTLAQLRNELEPLFGKQRAQLIAQTETTRAAAQGTLEGFRQSGVIHQVEWRAANDERVCPVCGPLHGTRVPLGETFGGLLPPAHPGCRCWVTAVVEEPKDTATGTTRVVRGPDLPTRIANLTERTQVLPLGRLQGGMVTAIDRRWPDKVTDQLVLTGERRAHYLERHPDVRQFEAQLPTVLSEPDEIHRNTKDPRIGIWYRKLDEEHFLRAVVWISNREGYQNSVHSFRIARAESVRWGREQGRVLWAK